MKIIVVDNINWKEAENDFAFRYNEIESFIVYPGFHIMEVINEACAQYINQDVCYLINVHCVFAAGNKIEEATLLQDQSGVSFYRHLLNFYSEQNRKLKVAFFSSIPKEILLGENQKSENEILNFYPFIEVPSKWEKFQEEIFSLNESDWLTFNNASENLLAGWALSNKEKINSSDKKIIFIDDQNEQWKTSLENIFSKTTQGKFAIEILPYKKEEEPKGVFSLTKLDASFKTKVKQSDLIISDFYLEENHEINHWMDKKELEQKSGFKLFNQIKKENKGVPVVMHTSSNKIYYYKIFDSFGIDNWFIKDIRPDAPKDERKENFLALKKSIEEILSNPYYEYLKELWKKVEELESLSQKTWWFSNSNFSSLIPNGAATSINERRQSLNGRWYDHQEFWQLKQADFEAKKQIVKIIKSSWFAIRRLINRETVFEQINENDTAGLVFDSFTPNAICNNLGKCLEILNIKSGNKRFSYLTNTLINIRNSASHCTDYEHYRLDDAFIYLDYLLKILLFKTRKDDELEIVNEFRNEWLIEEDGDFIKRTYDSDGMIQYDCSLFWIYLQFYNQDFSAKDLKFGNYLISKRIFELFDTANSNGYIHKVISTADIRPINKSIVGTGNSYQLEPTPNKKQIFIRCSN